MVPQANFQGWLDGVDRALAGIQAGISSANVPANDLHKGFSQGVSPILFARQVVGGQVALQGAAQPAVPQIGIIRPPVPSILLGKLSYWTLVACGVGGWIFGTARFFFHLKAVSDQGRPVPSEMYVPLPSGAEGYITAIVEWMTVVGVASALIAIAQILTCNLWSRYSAPAP